MYWRYSSHIYSHRIFFGLKLKLQIAHYYMVSYTLRENLNIYIFMLEQMVYTYCNGMLTFPLCSLLLLYFLVS